MWWLRGRRNNVNLRELAVFFLARSYASKARSVITGVERENGYTMIRFKGYPSPIYYPADADFRALNQVIVEGFYKDNWHYYQIEETKVGPDDIVVDCGAAEGLFSLMAAPVCGKIYLIEPSRRFVESLSLTFRGAENVEIIPCAISDKLGEAAISESGISSSLVEGGGQPVKVETIDNLFYRRNIRITYLKADLEGQDFAAIKGAEDTIRNYSPKIAITTYHDRAHARRISEFILKVNPRYRIKTKGIYSETGSPVMLHAWCRQ